MCFTPNMRLICVFILSYIWKLYKCLMRNVTFSWRYVDFEDSMELYAILVQWEFTNNHMAAYLQLLK